MKKVSALALLLVACFLFSMQLAAEPSGASNGIALGATVLESKIDMKEEVTAISRSETVAFLVAVLKPIVVSLLITVLSVIAYFAVLGHLNYTAKKSYGVGMQSLTDQFA
jgi:hypothetical protein